MTFPLVRQSVLVLGCVLTLQGCAMFSGKPALPKRASIEELQQPAAPTDFSAIVEGADVIYFPRDRALSGVKSEPAALLLEAVGKTGHPFAVAWDLIDASQQPLLDELAGQTGGAREALISKLELVGSGRAREHCRSVLRELGGPGLKHLALRCPANIIRKVAASEAFAPDEEPLVPRGFKRPRGGLESYAERFATADLSDGALLKSYRAELVRQQFAAERIVSYLRSSPDGSKVLVFLADSDLGSEGAVPYYVAQKAHVRQLVLGSDSPRKEQAKILTLWNDRPALEVVNRAPVSGRD